MKAKKAIVVYVENNGQGHQVSIDFSVREGVRSEPVRYFATCEEVGEYIRRLSEEYDIFVHDEAPQHD